MTDLEMMEIAAKAAGMDVHSGPSFQSGMLFRAIPHHNSQLVSNVEWNPLEDDGDALRLASVLNLDVDIQADHTRCWSSDGVITVASEKYRGDKFHQVRRTIVRAAAAIGERL